jgi:hypothetical protein
LEDATERWTNLDRNQNQNLDLPWMELVRATAKKKEEEEYAEEYEPLKAL